MQCDQPEKFENGVFRLVTHQMFSVHTTMGKFENAANTGHLGYVVQKTQSGKSHDYRDAIIFEKRLFFICFHYSKTHIQGFQIPPV